MLVASVAAGPPAAATQATQPATTQPASAPAEERVAISFKDVPVEQVCKFLSEKKDKPVIPHESVKGKKITIVSTKMLPLDEALLVLHEALREAGIMIVEYPNAIKLTPVSEAKHSLLPVIPPEQSVATIIDKAKIVDKVFTVKHYDVLKIKDLILPMLPSYGHVTADPNTRKLVVTDTVRNLERIEQVIASLDVPMADQTLKMIIQVKRGDASEIISILRPIIEATVGKPAKEISAGQPERRPGGPTGGPSPGGPTPPGGGSARAPGPGGAPPTSVTAVVIEASKTPVVLVTDVARNRIIAVAPAEIMKVIVEWVERLDEPAKVDKYFELFSIRHADMDEISDQIVRTIESMPNEELKKSIRVVPFRQSRKLLVFGSQRGREIVQELLAKLDVETSEYQMTREFQLKYEDADQVTTKLETLFSSRQLSYESYWGKSYRYDRAAAKVQVVPDTRRNTVTVITDAITMKRVEALINEWDKPLSPEEVEPRVYVLKHADPVQVKELLEEMFSRRQRSGSWMDILFFGRPATETTPVGRLFGQFSFQALPNSNKLIVTTKSPANYVVIDRLIEKLDQPQEAGLPTIIELKHANAEDLCERVNALLAETGTLASILRSQSGLRVRQRRGVSEPDRTGAARQTPEGADAAGGQVMPFWWQRARPRTDEQPSSNLIGKIRVVPYNRRNALMVLAPQAYLEPMQRLVEELDRPGLQVMIHAIVAEIQHDDVTTLGVRLASDASLLADPRLFDTSIRGGASVAANQLFGGTFFIGGDTFGRVVLQGNLNVSILIQALMKKFGMKVLFEPKLMTADNQESEFFDGQDVPVQTEARTSAEGLTTASQIAYQEVGTLLRVRPHITKEGDVDLTINLELSRIVSGETNLGNFIFDRRETTTHVIVKHGQTVMLSGITRKEDFEEVRKVPLLGDLPLIGPLFRSVDKAKRNRELLAFITPTVIGSTAEIDEKMKRAREGLEELKREMGADDQEDRTPTTKEAAP
ncbi:MAG: hypothetical protein AMJ81_09640 [Phycisphaerae bacterium SM23_33]|nr:MAG: hypothetical protein AMJ81_09640 [Phycisphaerae bacterium SM23_33]